MLLPVACRLLASLEKEKKERKVRSLHCCGQIQQVETCERCKMQEYHQMSNPQERCYKGIAVDEVLGFTISSTSICHNLILLYDPLKLAGSRWNKTHPASIGFIGLMGFMEQLRTCALFMRSAKDQVPLQGFTTHKMTCTILKLILLRSRGLFIVKS